MPLLPGKISHPRVGALVDLHCKNLNCLLSSHLSLMIPSPSPPSTPSSPAGLLLRKGPWHDLGIEHVLCLTLSSISQVSVVQYTHRYPMRGTCLLPQPEVGITEELAVFLLSLIPGFLLLETYSFRAMW